MTYEFAGFRLDRGRRTLTFEGRELALQPKVFALLCYLVEHRERVVTKRELLDALWPDVVVSEGSLKRAMSMLRGALQQGDARDAIRTHARQGYRFCLEVGSSEADPGTVPTGGDAHVGTRGRNQDIDSADALERAGKRALNRGQAREAIEALQRAIARYDEAGDPIGAGRSALHLSLVHFEQSELTVGRGWLQRGARYLPDAPELPEHGMHAWIASRYATAAGELARAIELASRAHAIGRRLGDANLEALGLLYQGMALVARGEVRRGCDHHDEAAATVLSADIEPYVGSLVYCGLIYTCRNRSDWGRASEWTGHFTRLCDETGMSGTCRLHRAQLLHVGGSLDDAQREAERICDELRELAPWALGDGHHLLGDLHLSRGELEAAEAAYRRAHELGWDPQPGLAQLLLAQDRPQAAVRALRRTLDGDSWHMQQRRGLLLTQLVHATLAADDPEAARAAHAQLREAPELCQTPALQGALAEAEAALALHAGDTSGAAVALRLAVARYGEANAPLDRARARIQLARALIEQGDTEGAELELATTERSLAGTGATPLEAQVHALRDRVV